MESTEVIAAVEAILETDGSIDCAIDDPQVAGIFSFLKKARVRKELAVAGIVADMNLSAQTISIYRIGEAATSKSPVTKKETKTEEAKATTKPKAKPAVKPTEHTYVAPAFHDDVVDIIVDDKSHNIWFWGPTGCGKTHYVEYLGGVLGRPVYRINCKPDMDSASSFGAKTIRVDEATGQNEIVFQEGQVPQAMKEGLDENGNEVGPAAILYIDEAAAIPPHISIGLNRLLENNGQRREIALDEDCGRVVRSHSQIQIICSANTIGRGLTSTMDAGYTAQADALDISTLNRMTASFRFGYSKSAEKSILREKVGDDVVTNQVLKFRDAVRGHIKQGMLSTPFSTRHIVAISDLYRISGNLGKALHQSVFNFVTPEEVSIYNETAMAALGVDILREYQDGDMDYME